jgi:hypothetical protein
LQTFQELEEFVSRYSLSISLIAAAYYPEGRLAFRLTPVLEPVLHDADFSASSRRGRCAVKARPPAIGMRRGPLPGLVRPDREVAASSSRQHAVLRLTSHINTGCTAYVDVNRRAAIVHISTGSIVHSFRVPDQRLCPNYPQIHAQEVIVAGQGQRVSMSRGRKP